MSPRSYDSALKPGFDGEFVIDGDQPCRSCNYNLRGLKRNGACPECGTPIRVHRHDPMSFCDLPPGTIGRFLPGFVLAALSVTGVTTLWIGSIVGAWNAKTAATLIVASAGVWLIASWLITATIELPDGEHRGFAARNPLRLAARWLQLGWVVKSLVAVHVAFANVAPGPTLNFFRTVSLSAELAGVIGVILLCVLLSRFAEWVRDDFAERCFDLAFGGLAIISPVVFVILPFFSALLPLVLTLGILLGAVWLLSLAAFPAGLWSLSRSLGWAAIHSRHKIARARREHDSLAPRAAHPVNTVQENLSEPIAMGDLPLPPRVIEHTSTKAIDDSAGEHGGGQIRRRPYVHDQGDASGHGGEPDGGII